jgi:4-hydroxybenzoyl-CoA reductase subunit beta
MRLPKFEYQRPQSVEEASAMLADESTTALPVAGGTDVLVAMKQGIATPQRLVDLGGIPGLETIEREDGTLHIGALTTLGQIAASPLVQDQWALLAQAAGKAASPQIRNLATIAGNVCLSRRCWFYNQSQFWRRSRPPCLRMGGAQCYVVAGSDKCFALQCADTVPPLLALEAKVRLVSASGERIVGLENLYLDLGPKAIDLEPGEILTEVLVPQPPSLSFGVYLRHSDRPSISFPLAGVAVMVRRDEANGVCEDARAAVGALCPKPLRLRHGEQVLKGQQVTAAQISKFVEVAATEIKPIPYIYQPPENKRRAVRNLLREAVEQAWQGAESSQHSNARRGGS